MATITINVPAQDETWLFDGIALRFKYATSIDNPAFDASLGVDPSTNPIIIPNPQSIEDFTKDALISFLGNEATQGYVTQEWVTRQEEQNLINIT